MPADPRRVKDLFVAALELPDPEARLAFLNRECGNDADLRRRLEVLLGAHDRPDSALEQPLAATGDEPNPAESVGTIVASRYKLLEPIGEGGMGTVWMAEQTEPVKRLVAVKLIKPGMDSRTVLARFEAERQALALMDHPNIAKVLDGGNERGRPFFVMELVKGIPLTDYCDERRLTVSQRLDLFVHVCSAVQHAHQKGVIHRDIKPSNILVTEHDGRPVPKVIDFGLAKALNRTSVLTDRTLHTAYGTVVGTPLYMAPEQVGINALDVDTRADVYALGVILYELLTGTTPLERKRFKEAAWEEAKRLIREEEPPKPSTRLSASDALPVIAARRHAEPARLSRLVRGELDWIVMKALEKDRNRRYETANGLARDVQRYMADEVIEARPPSAGYRVRKFVRRHKRPLVTAAAFAVLLVVGLVVSIWQAVRATAAEGQARTAQAQAETDRDRATQAEAAFKTERDTAIAAKRRADEQAAITQAVSDFLQKDLLNQAAMGYQPDDFARDPDVKVRTLLDRAAKNIEGRFANQPLTEAAIRLTIGNTYLELGAYTEAQPHIERAIELRAANLGADHLDTLQGKTSLAELLSDMGNKRAENLWAELIRVQTAKLGADHLDTLTSKYGLAAIYQVTEQYDRAEPLLLEVIQARAAKLGADDPYTLSPKVELARVHAGRGRRDQAEALYLEVIRTATTKLGADHGIVSSAKYGLAQLYRWQRKYTQAEQLFLEALRARTARLGADHPGAVGIKHALAMSYWFAGKYDQAESLYREVVQYVSIKSGPNYRGTLDTKQQLARVYCLQCKYEQAEPYLQDAAQGYTAVLGPDHDTTLSTKVLLLECYERTGQLHGVELLRRELAEAWKRKAGPESPRYAAELAWLGHNLLRQQKWAEAEPVIRECLNIREKAEPEAWTTFNTRSMLGGSLLGQKKYAEAEPLLRAGYEGMKAREVKIPPMGRARLPEAIERLIRLCQETDRLAEAANWQAELARLLPEMAPSPREMKP
jgi:tetratricopeptide (TPR) repeat protein